MVWSNEPLNGQRAPERHGPTHTPSLTGLPGGEDPLTGYATTDDTATITTAATALAARVTTIEGNRFKVYSTQVFLSSGTYTKPAGLLYARVRVVGGGGGGGGADNGFGAAGGGGGGGYAEEIFAAAAIGATETVTIGAAGAAGADTGGTGGTGGTTSLGSLISATGGTGGIGTAVAGTVTDPQMAGGGDGGIGSASQINAKGQPGQYGTTIVGASSSICMAGDGGGNPLGGGGKGTIGIGAAGGAGGSFGGGGGGAAANNTTNRLGGAGFKGVVIVEEFKSA